MKYVDEEYQECEKWGLEVMYLGTTTDGTHTLRYEKRLIPRRFGTEYGEFMIFTCGRCKYKWSMEIE